MWAICVGFVVHVVFLASIFDIYFKSPIVHGMQPHSSPLSPPARRLVLFVADGLRADSFFEKGEVCPFLRSVVSERGAWGVSHTRVPTETRPGHVALIAGLYEDPSAIAKGWKENPVEFDSIFNESQETWSWGSPDILPMFSKGASRHHVWMEMYDSEEQDFSGKHNTTRLDLWVFDRVKKFFHEAQSDEDLRLRLHQDRIIFFLHLLGLDTAGHTHKPYSREYEENLRVVDQGVREVEQLLEEFYGFDNQTAFVFTSDHGMTDWGSHGAGDVSETTTPLVVWGAGVSGPRPSVPRRTPASPTSWGLGHLARRDVAQADITPLMASLVGIPVPVNNVGVLPKEYLDIPDLALAEAVFANARQIATQYTRKREMTEDSTVSWLYQPFPALAPAKEEELVDEVRSNIYGGRYREAVALSEVLMKTCLSGLKYFETYYQALLLTCVTLAFLGWICWLLSSVLLSPNAAPEDSKAALQGGVILNSLFLCLFGCTVYLVWVQRLPAQMFIYCTLPELLWWSVARQHSVILPAIRNLKSSQGSLWPAFGLVMLCTAGVEILVLAFFWRAVLTVALLVLAMWPLVFYWHIVPGKLLAAWVATSTCVAVFPALPVVGKEADSNLVQLTGLLWLVLSGAAATVVHRVHGIGRRSIHVLALLMLCLLLAVWDVHSTEFSFRSREGLPLLNQLLSWTLCGLCLVLPLAGSQRVLPRLQALSLALGIPFLLLSASHEPLFLLALNVHLLCWLLLETHLAPGSWTVSEVKFHLQDFQFKDKMVQHYVSHTDFRRAYFFLLYVILSFFGTGNIASLNSFDPTWVRCFVTVFSPFLMTMLILWKTVIPFFMVTCVFRAQNVLLQVPADRLFLLVLVLCDLVGMHFLHLVTNEGSWLDIGTSISHFVIVQATTLFLLLLYGLARLYTGAQWPPVQSIHTACVQAHRSLESGSSTNPSYSNCLLDVRFALANEHTTTRKRHFE